MLFSVVLFNGVSGVKLESLSFGEGSSYILFCKVIVKDIIKLWEIGYGDLLFFYKWMFVQKVGQCSKFLCWIKIYDIYKYYCKGDLSLFELKFLDECGELYFVIMIVVMFDVWELLLSLFSFFVVVFFGQKIGEGIESEIY